jgi:hypothetical protein
MNGGFVWGIVFLSVNLCQAMGAQQPAVDTSPRYRLIQVVGTATLQEKVDEATGEGFHLVGVVPASGGTTGFRLVSRDIALDWSVPKSVIAWMARTGEHNTKYEYAVIGFGAKMALKASLNPKLWANANPLDYIKPEIQRATDSGYRLVRIVSGVAVILEKADATGGETPTAATKSRAAEPRAFVASST